MLSKFSTLIYLLLFIIIVVYGQGIKAQPANEDSKPQRFVVSGYMQPQWELGQQAAVLRVGKSREDYQDDTYNRVGIRRGRIKFLYDDGNLGSGGFQFNVIDKPGINGAQVQIKELYLNVKAPWNKLSSLQAGVFNRPFGFEVNYSTASIESPERAMIITRLLPDECDLGGMVVLRPDKYSPLNFMYFQGGLFAGNGINPETDNRKDFIGQLVANKSFGKNLNLGLGISYYYGGVYQTNDSVYTMQDDAFLLNVSSDNKGAYAKREYIGFDAQIKYKSILGLTQLRGEYVFGTQPGSATNNCSPSRARLPLFEDTYVRPFSGGYLMLVQDIGKSPFSAVVKYDLYDPNSALKGNQIGVADTFTGIADIQYSTLGAGLYWQITPDIRTTLYYEFITNERTTALANHDFMKDYAVDRNDNLLTFRIQYKFCVIR